jgi:hypothetical protein
VKGSTTYLPNAEDRAITASTIAAASTAPSVSLSPASHIAETAGDEIDVIILPLALPPIDAAPHATTTTKKRRKKAMPVAAPAATTDDTLTATPTPTTAPATKKGKTTGKKKISERFLQVKSETLYSTEGIKRGNSIQTLGRSALRHDDGTGKWMPAGMTKPSKVVFVRVKRDLPATFLYTLRTTPPSCVVFGSLY